MSAFVFAATIAAAGEASAQWQASAYDGEGRKAVMGCASEHTDDTWMCMAIRCHRSQLSLHMDYGEGDLDLAAIDIDGRRYPASASEDGGEAPYSQRVLGDASSIIAALKAGRSARLVTRGPPLPSGYDVISLEGAGRHIGRVESICR